MATTKSPAKVERETRAERRERIREELIEAADELFRANGFHATTVEQIAASRGYSKGAVYSNFDSKEDLFFAVYERRADATAERVDELVERHGVPGGLEQLSLETLQRRSHDDGWLPLFYEFWTHVVRNRTLRNRFVGIHERAMEPLERASARLLEDGHRELGVDSKEIATAMMAMHTGLSLERLTRPETVDETLGARMSRVFWR